MWRVGEGVCKGCANPCDERGTTDILRMSVTSEAGEVVDASSQRVVRENGISREEVMRAIRQEPAWRALPLGEWAMRAAPGDIGVGALFAARLAGRGAGNLASGCMGEIRKRLKNAVEGGGRGIASGGMMGAGQFAAVDQELAKAQEAFLRGTQAPCATREVREAIARRLEKIEGGGQNGVGSVGEQVREFAGACEWYVSEDGSAFGVQGDGVIWGLESDVQAGKEAVEGMLSEFQARGGAGFLRPILIAGLHNPSLLMAALSLYTNGYNGYMPRIYVFEPDVKMVATALAHEGMDAAVGDARVCWAVGEDAQTQLRELFYEHRYRALPECAYQQPRIVGGVGVGVGACCSAILEQAQEAQAREMQSMQQKIERAYAEERRSWEAARKEAWEGARVLVLTSRYTTFLKHSAHDLAEALSRQGARVKVLMEPDDFSLHTTGAYLNAICEHEPDVVFTINYPRSFWGGMIPKNVPLVCWVQDAMPHLFDCAAGAGQGERDVVVGHLYPELFEKFGFSQERAVAAAVVADEVKFHATAVDRGALEKYACDVALVSHHSETPEAMHQRLVASAKVAPAIASVMERVYGKLNEVVEQAARVAPVRAVERVILDSMREVTGGDGEEKSRILLLRTYAMPLADRMLRHQTLGWLDEMMVRRGWTMKLYGKGWENHPTLHKYAAGELDHGEALAGAYQGAKVHLHVSLHSLVHQRVLECYLSGGMCLVRWHRDALAGLKTTAHLALSRCEPDARMLRKYDATGNGVEVEKEHVGYLISKHEAARVLARQYAALGQPVDEEMLWIPSTRLANLAAMGPRVNTQTDIGGLLGEDFESGVFRNSGELEAKIHRVLTQGYEDPQGRLAQIQRVRDRVIQGYTFGALLERVHRVLCAGHGTGVDVGVDGLVNSGRGQ